MAISVACSEGASVNPATRTSSTGTRTPTYKRWSAATSTPSCAPELVVMAAGCGPAWAAKHGTLAPANVPSRTSMRNYRPPMGSPDAEIYLANPAVAAGVRPGRGHRRPTGGD